MSGPLAKNLFALVCLLGAIAIATGSLLEISRTRRGESVITPVQFRLRMASAFIWMLILGSLAYALFLLWPAKGETVRQLHFISVVSGSVLLTVVAVCLLGADLWLLAQQRRRQEARLGRELEELARAELAKVNRLPVAKQAPALRPPAEPRP